MTSSNNNLFVDKFNFPKRFRHSIHCVWNEYVKLIEEYRPLDIGAGFSDYAMPAYITDNLAAIVKQNDPKLFNYTRCYGHPRLVAALSKLYSRLVDRQIDANTEILVSTGAYGALCTAIQGLIDDGDEVIIIEPFFDCYEPMVKIAGGVPRFIPLRLKESNADITTSADWVLDDTELENLFNEKTKMIILNTPNSPLGKVFNRNELTKIADLCKKYNVLCLSDEVYEWIVYDNKEHIRICTLPDMWERTITIGSAGKTFSATGWRIGWAYGPANLLFNMQMVHQNFMGSNATTIQEAFAIAFETEFERLSASGCYFNSLPVELKSKRDVMVNVLREIGMRPIIPDGGYFILADWSQLAQKMDLSSETDPQKDYRLTKWMTKNLRLLCLPSSAFFGDDNKHLMENYIRICFFKKDETLQAAADILRNWQ